MLRYKTGIAGSAQYYYRPTQSATELAEARYYAVGYPPDPVIQGLAEQVNAGRITHAEAVDALVTSEIAREIPTDPAVSLAQVVFREGLSFSEAIDHLHYQYPAYSVDPDTAESWARACLEQELDKLDLVELRYAKVIDQEILFGTNKLTVPEARMSPEMAGLLGLEPGLIPTPEHMGHLMRAHRADGSPVPGKRYAGSHEYTDSKTGRIKKSNPVGFIDLTWAPHKSVSIAQAFAEPAEAALLWKAHVAAADETTRYVERSIGQVRRGDGGAQHLKGEIACISFDHATARPTSEDGKAGPSDVPGDLQMHRHTIVPNITRTPDGQVGSLYLGQMGGKVKEFGFIYQAVLARNLRALGADVVQDDQGYAVLRTVPEKAVRFFSKRSTQAEAVARATDPIGWHNLPEAEKTKRRHAAAQHHRLPKVDGVSNKARWLADAEHIGYRYRSVIDIDRPMPIMSRERRLDKAFDSSMKFLEDAFERSSVITAQDVRVACAKGLVKWGIDSPEDIDEQVRSLAKRGVVQRGERTAIIWGTETDPLTGRETVKVTTAFHVKHEREFVALAKRAAQDRRGSLTPRQTVRAVRWAERNGINFDTTHGRRQKQAFEQVAKSGRLGLMIGAAGSGKSVGVLRPLVHAYHQQGRDVWGTAVAWRQTGDFAAAGVPHNRRLPISEFVKHAKSGQIKLDRNSVLAIDEVATVNGQTMLEIMRLRERYGFSIIGFGDDAQTQAVEHGNVVSMFRRALGPRVAEIETSIRQVDQRQLDIADHLRHGRTRQAVEMMREDGSLIVAEGGQDRVVARIATLWQQRMNANRGDPDYTLTVSTPSNRDALEVGRAIREFRVTAGEVETKALTLRAAGQGSDVYDLNVAVGDRLRLFNRIGTGRGQAPLAVNGDVVEVLKLDRSGMTIRNAEGVTGSIRWRQIQDEKTGRVRLTYGYAQVINPLQGVTSTEHISAAPRGTGSMTRYSAYTGGSRHTHQHWLVTSEMAERQQISRARPIGSSPPTLNDVWEQIERNLFRAPPKESALDLLERAKDVREGAVDTWQRAMHRRVVEAARTAQETPQAIITAARLKSVEAMEKLAGALAAVKQKVSFASIQRPMTPDL